MRNQLTSFPARLLLVIVLLLPTIIYAQQDDTTKPPSSGGASERSRAEESAASRRVNAEAAAKIDRSIAEALTIIQDNYVDGGKLDYNAVFKSSIIGMLRSLDPHSNYFDSAEFDEFRTDQRSEYSGIGSSINDLRDGDKVDTFIRATLPDSPALRAGLRFGDRILEIDGESMRNKSSYEVSAHLRGPRGTQVKVTVERAASDRTETFTMTREAVAQPSIPEAYLIKPGVGYIAMTGGFNTTTADELRAALKDLHARGMQMLVLDLRGNGGGLVAQAVRVANTFLQRGQLILTQRGRFEGSSETYVADNDAPDTTPLVVMVNSGTASASEIVAGALQDHDRALIVGETSFGKGLVQIPFPLEYGSALMLTIAKYYTPSGRLIQRDYSNSSFYDYYTRGGSLQTENQTTTVRPPSGPESRTDTGRIVYGGGGITPDETVKPRLVAPRQQRLIDPVFAFAIELSSGRMAGFDAYKITRPVEFGHDLGATDFPVTDALYKAFKDFVASKPAYKPLLAQLDRDRAFIELQLRYDLATAAFGTTTALQVFNADDPQIRSAIALLPRARELAQAARRTRNPS